MVGSVLSILTENRFLDPQSGKGQVINSVTISGDKVEPKTKQLN
jgi:hypothetical protein